MRIFLLAMALILIVCSNPVKEPVDNYTGMRTLTVDVGKFDSAQIRYSLNLWSPVCSAMVYAMSVFHLDTSIHTVNALCYTHGLLDSLVIREKWLYFLSSDTVWRL